jgi:hypothetical protein
MNGLIVLTLFVVFLALCWPTLQQLIATLRLQDAPGSDREDTKGGPAA